MGDKTTILALFKDGVLRPLEPLDLPEGARVEVTIDPLGLVKRLDDLLREIHERNKDIPLEQVEAAVDRVIREVRGQAGLPALSQV
ncbi:MAG TPA: antitoxin family protein [bacterium]|nr:antitoxin family protein [bacterium]